MPAKQTDRIRCAVVVLAFVYAIAPHEAQASNVVLGPCDARSFALSVSAPLLDDGDRTEITSQLAIGFLTRGYALCNGSPKPLNRIIIGGAAEVVTITVIYDDETLARQLTIEPGDDAKGLAVALAAEELALIATDPNAPRPPPPPPPEAHFRLGVDGTALAYANTHVGFRLGGRYDLMLTDRFRLGVAVGGGHVASKTDAAGQARYGFVDAQVGLHMVLVRGERLRFIGGVAAAPILTFVSGKARSGYTEASDSGLALSARVLADLEYAVTGHQTIALRAGIGRPLASVVARSNDGSSYGGVATWEALLGVAWLWSFY